MIVATVESGFEDYFARALRAAKVEHSDRVVKWSEGGMTEPMPSRLNLEPMRDHLFAAYAEGWGDAEREAWRKKQGMQPGT